MIGIRRYEHQLLHVQEVFIDEYLLELRIKQICIIIIIWLICTCTLYLHNIILWIHKRKEFLAIVFICNSSFECRCQKSFRLAIHLQNGQIDVNSQQNKPNTQRIKPRRNKCASMHFVSPNRDSCITNE